jgi:DNA-binding protein HU-beta
VAVNRTELVEAVSAKTGLDKKQAEAAVAAVAETVVGETKSGSKVAIFGFGTFSPSARAARMGRNPQTGAPVRIAASRGVRFAPASAFKDALNAKKAAAKKAAPAKKAAAKKATAKKAAPAKKVAAAKKVSAKKAAKTTKKR